MSPEIILLSFLLVTVPIGVGGVWLARHLLNKHVSTHRPVFAPSTPKDSWYGYGFVTLACLMAILVFGMQVFDLAYPLIRPISEITRYNGSNAELLLTLSVIAAFVAARYISYLRVLFFSFLLVFLLLLFLFGRDVVNVQWDTSKPAKFVGTIVARNASTGGRKSGSPSDYYLHVVPAPGAPIVQIPVSAETYRTAVVGDGVSLEIREGFFAKRWASGKVLVLPKTR